MFLPQSERDRVSHPYIASLGIYAVRWNVNRTFFSSAEISK
jgi:hypothetical protein